MQKAATHDTIRLLETKSEQALRLLRARIGAYARAQARAWTGANIAIVRGYNAMSHRCALCGKARPQFGNNVSFSQRHTKKVWKPNLQAKTVIVDGKKVKMKISTQAIRTLKKKGLLDTPAAAKTA